MFRSRQPIRSFSPGPRREAASLSGAANPDSAEIMDGPGETAGVAVSCANRRSQTLDFILS